MASYFLLISISKTDKIEKFTGDESFLVGILRLLILIVPMSWINSLSSE